MRRWKRFLCWLLGHKISGHIVTLAYGETPEGEPSIAEYERWTGLTSDIIGTALEDSYRLCERCKRILR